MKVEDLEKQEHNQPNARILARLLRAKGFKDTNEPDSKTWMRLCAEADAEAEKQNPSN